MDIRNPQARDAGQKIINSPPVVLILIATLIAIHLALTLAGEDWQIWCLAVFGFNSLRLLPGPLTVVCNGPTPVHATSKDTWWVPPRLSLATADPTAVTLFRSAALVIIAGAVGAPQVNEMPPGQTAWN